MKFNIEGDTLYFMDFTEGCSIGMVKLDGTNSRQTIQIPDEGKNNCNGFEYDWSGISILKDSIYYSTNNVIDKSGENYRQLTNSSEIYEGSDISDVNFIEDLVFFSYKPVGSPERIFRKKIDSDSLEELTDSKTEVKTN